MAELLSGTKRSLNVGITSFSEGTTTLTVVGISSLSDTDVNGTLNVTGVVTATSFSGSGANLTGIVTSISSGSGISIDQSTGNVTITATGGGAQVSISTEAPSSPSAGDLWYNSLLARTFIYYNDGDSSQWVDSSPFTLDKSEIVKEEFTVSGSQSTFYLSDTYTNGYIDVYVNGSKLASSDFVETASNIITLTQSADDGDIVVFVNYKTLTTNTRNNTQIIKEIFPVTSTQSLFTLTEEYIQGYIDVYVNGVKLTGLDFTQTSSNSITLTNAAESDDVVEVVNYKAVSVSSGTATGVPDWRDFSLF